LLLASAWLLAFGPVAAQASDTSQATRPFLGYSWSEVAPELDNLVRPAWVTMDNLLDPGGVKEATDKMPPGHRAVFLWNVDRDITGHPEDRCLGKDGSPVAYDSIWLDHGVAVVQERLDTFFQAYKRMGGKLDVVVVDWEGGLSVWHIGKNIKHWKAIEADPRFPHIANQLGFSSLTSVGLWWLQVGDRRLNYLRWNALMFSRMADYLNQAIYEPIRRHYPDVKLSNYRFFHHTKALGVPDRNGHRPYLFGHGAHVGTHQSAPLYAWLGQIEQRPPDGVRAYPHTPFNGFRHSLNRMRCMVGSSDVPVYPWLAYRGFFVDYIGVTHHDLYQELVFHVGLSGPDAFLFWNPRPWKEGQDPAEFTTDKQDRLFSDCLSRLTELAGSEDRNPVTKGLVPWSSGYALSGMRADGRTIWRFTPDLGKKGRREHTLVSRSPAVFKVGKELISIPGGRILTPETELSTQGYWIEAPAEAEAPHVP